MNRLKTQLKTRILPLLCALVLLSAFAGCKTTKSIYVPAGDPVRLAQTVKGVDIWVADKNGVLIKSRMDLPEGWWVLPDPGEDAN